MQSVFVAGSRAMSKLNAKVKERLENIVKQNFTVLVGDANGADKAVQRYLADRRYQRVVVYCMDVCRNNVGNWPTHEEKTRPGLARDRHYYGIKDLAMAKDASAGDLHHVLGASGIKNVDSFLASLQTKRAESDHPEFAFRF